jgi:hypothetical protein
MKKNLRMNTYIAVLQIITMSKDLLLIRIPYKLLTLIKKGFDVNSETRINFIGKTK